MSCKVGTLWDEYMNKVIKEIKYKIIYSSDFQWNDYTFIFVKENGINNCTSKKSLLGYKVGKWKSGIDT